MVAVSKGASDPWRYLPPGATILYNPLDIAVDASQNPTVPNAMTVTVYPLIPEIRGRMARKCSTRPTSTQQRLL